MKLIVNMKLNSKVDISIDFEGDNLQDLIKQAGPLLEFEGKCPMNDSEDIGLRSRETKEGFKFTEYYDKKDGYRQSWGAYKDGSGFFLRKEWQQPFVAQEKGE